jgi:hypothetical protein
MNADGRVAQLFESLSPLKRIVIVYTFIRVVLFIAVAAIMWVIPLNNIVRVAVALVVSGLLSYPLARRQRTELAERLAERRQLREQQGR